MSIGFDVSGLRMRKKYLRRGPAGAAQLSQEIACSRHDRVVDLTGSDRTRVINGVAQIDDSVTLQEERKSALAVQVLMDRETGRSRGFAFVEMANAEEGEKAIAGLNGAQLSGRTINVNEARPKAERASSGGGRDRGRGR